MKGKLRQQLALNQTRLVMLLHPARSDPPGMLPMYLGISPGGLGNATLAQLCSMGGVWKIGFFLWPQFYAQGRDLAA